MLINGLQKLTLLDFPGRTACTVFLGGCNYRCPFCQNPALVLNPEQQPVISEDDFFAFLDKRRRLLDGVCVTGGEPSIQPGLPEFIDRIKRAGYAVKLDTNGGRPDMLHGLFKRGLLDYVAMDIKSSPSAYSTAAGIPDFDMAPVYESAYMLMNGNIPFEFRITAVKGIHTASDFNEIGLWLKNAPRFFIQNFKNNTDLVGRGNFNGEMSPFSPAELNELLAALQRHIPSALLRGEN